VVLFGFLTWLIPFLVSILVYPLHAAERPLFESIMPVVITACAVFFPLIYFREVAFGSMREGIELGLAWLMINLFLDLQLFMQGPMKTETSKLINSQIEFTCPLSPLRAAGYYDKIKDSGGLAQSMAFQWGHFFSEMDRAAILRPLQISKRARFSRGSLTSSNMPEQKKEQN